MCGNGIGALGNSNVARPQIQQDIQNALKSQGPVGDKLQKFLDAFDKAAQGSPELQGMMNGEAMKALREIAKLLSQAKTGQGGQVSPQAMNGMCGSGGAQNQVGALAQNGCNFNPAAGNAVQNPQQQQALSGGCAGAGGCGGGGCQPSGGGGGTGNPELDALAAGGGAFFEDRIFAVMCKVVKDMQKQIEEKLNKLQSQAKAAEAQGGQGGGGGGAEGGGGMGGAGGQQGGQESRNIEFEKIKMDIQKLSQMQQAMSNVLNTMDELAKSAIRHIKSG